MDLKEYILKLNCPEKEKLGMLFSYRSDKMYNGNAAITVERWDDLFDDLIAWKNENERGWGEDIKN